MLTLPIERRAMGSLLPAGLTRRAGALLRLSRPAADRQRGPSVTPAGLAVWLAQSPHSHVAFDVFDTLVERTVAPEHVKLLAADRLCRLLGWSAIDGPALFRARQEAESNLCRRTFGKCGELEFRFSELADELIATLAAQGLALARDDQDRMRALMLDCEQAVERSVLRPIDAAIAALSCARKRGKKIVLVSDFYLPKPSLIELLAPFVTLAPSETLFVSSDLMASKRSGRLYPALCAALGISPPDLLMVGDNPHSDYAQARASGIDAVLLHQPERVAFYDSPAASALDSRAAQAAMRHVLERAPRAPSRNLRAVVPSLYLFAARLYAGARQAGHRDLFFLAREGEPLRAMFEIYQDSLGCRDAERIRTHDLRVSRRSCYAPSLRALDEESFHGLFRYYRRMSVRDFLQSLGLAPDRIALLNAEIDGDFDETIENFPASKALTDLRGSALFRASYEEHRRTQRANLLAYLESFGVPLARAPLVLVDIGWKGSIQDYLTAALASKSEVAGYYFGLLNIGQPLANKCGLMFTNVPAVSPFYRTYTENRTLFELLLCTDHGSALRYDARADGGIDVVLDDDADELAYIRKELLPLRDDVLAAFRAFCAVGNRYCLTETDIAAFAAQTHAELVFRPWRANARALAAARHRENFGSYATSRYSAREHVPLRDKLHFWRGLMRNPRAALATSFWPALTLYQHSNTLLTRLYAAARRHQDDRARRALRRPGGGA